MPLFVTIGHDAHDGTARRAQHRAEHVAYIEALDAAGKITFAGPIQSDDRAISNGVVVIFDAADLDEAKRLAHDDPYVKGGVYAVLEVSPIRKVFPKSA
jgi:uncharacterized protein YciI